MVAILAMALPMLLLPISAPHRMAVLLLPVVWGIAYGAMPVAMQVWLAKTAQDASEAGMVLFVTSYLSPWVHARAACSSTAPVSHTRCLRHARLYWRRRRFCGALPGRYEGGEWDSALGDAAFESVDLPH